MTTSESDPLAAVLNEHIWYTTSARTGKRIEVICKCRATMADTDEHAEHLARIARNFLAAA